MFSVVMPTYNRASLLARTLEAVMAVRGIGDCEVIVVDDGSPDNTPAVLADVARRHPNLKPLRQANAGAAAARNHAVANAHGDWILCLDDDVRPVPELLEAHRERLDSGSDVSQGNIVWDESLLSDPVVRYIERMGLQFHLDRYRDGDAVSYRHVYTANVAFRARDFHAAGGFDDFFTERRYGFEDTALAWRMERDLGLKIGFAAKAGARHFHPWTEASLLKTQYSIGYNLAFAKRNYPAMARDLNVDRMFRGVGWKLPLVAAADKSGIAGLLGGDFRRRVAVKHAFLRGCRDGMQAAAAAGKETA